MGNGKPPDIAVQSIPDTLTALQVNPRTGLTSADVDARRKEHGYNEVAEQKGHPTRGSKATPHRRSWNSGGFN